MSTESLQETKANAAPAELQLVVYTLGKEEYGVDINNVQEIIRMPAITRMPNAPVAVEGLTSLRGRIITVLNPSVILGMERIDVCDDTRVVVMNMNGVVMGFVVDSVREVLRLPSNNVELGPAIIGGRINADNLIGIGKLDNRLLILLNIDGILGGLAAQGG